MMKGLWRNSLRRVAVLRRQAVKTKAKELE